MTTQTAPEIVARRESMRTLALADVADLAAAWQAWRPAPVVDPVRGPEAGLVMVRGRTDAGGVRFNLGEATVTRATVRLHGAGLQDDVLGHAYVLGSDLEHARLAAAFDGLLADPGLHDRVLDEVIAPLARTQAQRDRRRRDAARRTRVDFFTVSREHS
ncbi:MAG: phosphonate C-P lyase system protein PhnG [Pseudonocardia sp.]|nr:phosphonate C-P lyase system protein PhnG [Pseudonocardia sp.]